MMRRRTDRDAMLARLADLFRCSGSEIYAGEAVTVADHMLQCAALARAEHAPDALVAAALLHDVGHLTGADVDARQIVDDRQHEQAGAALLAGHFPEEVTEPIRLHVAAKRYLCATDALYADALSPASRHSLALQGGVMDAQEIAAFERSPYHEDAVRVRRWDDGGKSVDMAVPPFDAYRSLLGALMT